MIIKKIAKKTPILKNFIGLKNSIAEINFLLNEQIKLNDWQYRDLVDITSGKFVLKHNDSIQLKTEHPIAYESDDHLNPYGTAQDNTRNPRFVDKCVRLYKDKMSFLDLGCSGGGLVFDFALRGYDSIGLEGSDYSKKLKFRTPEMV
jgi:hypothetical protein